AGATGGNQNSTPPMRIANYSSTARLRIPKDRGPGQNEIVSSGHPQKKKWEEDGNPEYDFTLQESDSNYELLQNSARLKRREAARASHAIRHYASSPRYAGSSSSPCCLTSSMIRS